ncbi:MAG TPA: hypothetical protein VGK24_05865 [Candidatus Angelobacter sp.]|jgi:hypothetical protein
MIEPNDNSLVELIENLGKVKVNEDRKAEYRRIREKCDKAFLPFAESQIQFIDKDNLDEEAAHILALHEGAFTLRRECDSLLGSKSVEESEIAPPSAKIREIFDDCCARIENIYSLRRPDLMESVVAVL